MSESTTLIAPATAARKTTVEPLFEPVRLGRYDLPHRMVMAPLTRSRARQPGNVPSALNACYYAQRASAALIVTEATQVAQQGQGYAWTPGIHSREQVEGWRLVTDAVHMAGGLIFLQLWHVGRISHPSLQPDGTLPVAPSAIKPRGEAFIENENGQGELVPFVTPRALQIEEMPYIVRQYTRGSRNALEAGFDGVHVGQQDMSPGEARKIVGSGRIVGVSTHNEIQVRDAEKEPVDYIAVGPIYATASKQNPDPVVGLEGIRMARTLTSKSLVAIGGITMTTALEVRSAGADSIAVISAIFAGSGRPAKLAKDFLDIFR